MSADHAFVVIFTVFKIVIFVTAVSPVTTVSPVTDDELRAFSHDLLELDNYTLLPSFNLQAKAGNLSVFQPLFSESPIHNNFVELFDYYTADIQKEDTNNATKESQIDKFLDAILATKVMTKVKDFLIEKGAIGKTDDFKTTLHKLWFRKYPRKPSKVLGSSGFEHVFVGEHDEKKKIVHGLHNWIRFHHLERKGTNYLGYHCVVYPKPSVTILSIKLSWKFTKRISSMFIGTSPEFEIGIYTVCFIFRKDKSCPVKFGTKILNIKTFSHKCGRGTSTCVSTAYPIITCPK